MVVFRLAVFLAAKPIFLTGYANLSRPFISFPPGTIF